MIIILLIKYSEAAMNTEVHAQTQICNYASAIYK